MLLKTVLVVLVMCFPASGGTLFKSAWYKMGKKGDKKRLEAVQSLNPSTMPNSTYLKLRAAIPSLPSGAIEDLERLEDLVITNCGIRQIQPGAFRNLPQLKRLNLKNNGIERIREGVFNSLPVVMLFLNRNDVKVIEEGAFDNMVNLTKIKLNSNKVTKWDPGWFKNTPALVTVSFRRNLMELVPEKAFGSFARSNTRIFLSKNHISSIDPRAFEGLTALKELWLDRNKLVQLHAAVFGPLSHVDVISLAKNNLTEVPPALLGSLQVKKLDLSANYRLKCVPFEVARAAKEVRLHKIRNLNCTCMEEVKKGTDLRFNNNDC